MQTLADHVVYLHAVESFGGVKVYPCPLAILLTDTFTKGSANWLAGKETFGAFSSCLVGKASPVELLPFTACLVLETFLPAKSQEDPRENSLGVSSLV